MRVPELIGHADEALHQLLPVVERHVFEEVESDRPVSIARIEDDNIPHTPRRDALQGLIHQLPMRIADAHTPAGLDILTDEVEKKRGFSRASLPHNVCMEAPACHREHNWLASNSAHIVPQQDSIACHGRRMCQPLLSTVLCLFPPNGPEKPGRGRRKRDPI